MATRMPMSTKDAYYYIKRSLDHSLPARRATEGMPTRLEELTLERDEAVRRCERYRDALQLIANIDPDELGVYRYIAKDAIETK